MLATGSNGTGDSSKDQLEENDDWKLDAKGKMVHDPNLTKKNASTTLGKDEKYVGEFASRENSDNTTTLYRENGTIDVAVNLEEVKIDGAPNYYPSGDYGPSMGPTTRELATGMQDLGDSLTFLGAGFSLSILGAEIGIPMMAVGGNISLFGTALELGVDASEGKWSNEKALTKITMELIPFAGNKMAAKTGEKAVGRLLEVSTVMLDRALDDARENKNGPYTINCNCK